MESTNAPDSLDRIVEDYLGRRISRRAFVRRSLALGVALPAATGLLAACGGDEEAATTAEGEPRTGGELREGYDLDFSRMDPIATNWYDPGFFALYEKMVTQNPDGEYVPMVAESWEFSEDGRTATFKIREGLKFHSGDPLDAAAIKAVYDTIADPESGSPLRTLWAPVESVEAPDPTRVVIKLKHPFFGLLNVVKTGYWSFVNTKTRERLGAAEYGKTEIDGSGPFTFVEWVPGSNVTVKRWEDYPGSIVPYFENKRKSRLDSIRWIAILEAAQRAIQIEGGEIDTLRGPNFPDVERLKGNDDLNVIELAEWSGYIVGLNFKMTELGFDDIRVRQAVSHAMNRQAIIDSIFFGLGEPLFGPIVSADPGYTTQVEQFNQFDLDRAKQLMSEAGWEPGADGILSKGGKRMEFNMVVQAETFNEQIASALQGQLRELGADVKVQIFDRGTYFNKLFGGEEDSFLFFYLWPVPMDVVTLFVNSAAAEGAGPNWANAKIPEVDQAIADYLSAANEEELNAANATLQLEIAEKLPIIPVVNRSAIWVQRKNVHGWLPQQWVLYPYYNDVWLEQ